MHRRARWAAALLALAAACTQPPPDTQRSPAPTATTIPAPVPSTEPVRRPATQTPATDTVVRVRVERRTRDPRTADFAATVMAVLTDQRGWRRAGITFVEDPAAEYRIVLAEGRAVDRLCRPYDTEGRYSCQNGPTVALNADRWRRATPSWPLDLDAYRVMLVNHEVGHLLHLHHPQPQCPGPGLPAPVMTQQSTTLAGCRANPWPLEWEVALLRRRAEPFAPPARHDPSDHRPSPPPEGGG